MQKTSKPLSVLLAVMIALALLTGAIAAPILCRPFYYAHIGPLALEERTGLTRDEIKTAYGEMLDYCLGQRPDFSTGVLKWSDSGRSHFTDVRGLFLLDLTALACALGTLGALAYLTWKGRIRPARLLGRGPAFWAGAGLGIVFLIVAALAALDFNRAFVVFHALFFPGKDNWLFDPTQDQIINLLPEAFFRNCAILILAILVLGCVALIIFDLRHTKLKKFRTNV
ncbi:MAG: TIGR01906 family membrane protein [Oscillospiraceae bacterium]|nr:TIGR01906 family membrane protein [Oscillospiraceae bacterium]